MAGTSGTDIVSPALSPAQAWSSAPLACPVLTRAQLSWRTKSFSPGSTTPDSMELLSVSLAASKVTLSRISKQGIETNYWLVRHNCWRATREIQMKITSSDTDGVFKPGECWIWDSEEEKCKTCFEIVRQRHLQGGVSAATFCPPSHLAQPILLRVNTQ